MRRGARFADNPPMERRRLALGVLLVGAALLPRPLLERLPPICPVRLATGYPCPTCGMTRSWHSVARLEPMRALRDHPFGPPVLAVLAAGAWSPASADAIAAAARQVPTGIKVAALVAWVGWWLSRLVAAARLR
jgi:hypothetical protein